MHILLVKWGTKEGKWDWPSIALVRALAWGQIVGARYSLEANLGEWMWARGEPTRVVGDSEKRLWTVCKCVLGPSVYEARGGPVSASNMALAWA